jgi:TonB family protein
MLACFALIGAAHAATSNVEPLKENVGWRVTINPQGHVTAMTAVPHERVDKVPQIRARLEQEVRGWQFLPGLVDGKPAETQTGLYLRVTLIATSDNAIRIQLNHFDVGATEAHMTAPHYPANAIRHHKTGQVVLAVAYDAEGNVVSAKPADDSPKVDPMLIAASEESTRKWKFQPEVVGGHPLAGRALLPFCFTLRPMGSNRIEGKCDWKPQGSKDALRDGETLALDPAAKLLTDIAGRTL